MIETEKFIGLYKNQQHLFEQFRNAVVDCFKLEPTLNHSQTPTIHSIKSRLKDVDHLKDKLERKFSADNGMQITEENFFEKITDLAGVRVLHLYQDQFPQIHKFIQSKIELSDWYLAEQPTAYSWDPEAQGFFEALGLEVKLRDTYYTSIHYLVKPKQQSNVCCEIQVRTLFEEIWGEIDHTINYPVPVTSIGCKEQLRVLSKLVSTGTRLADSIFRTHSEQELIG